MASEHKRIPKTALFESVANFFALGAGSGLAPKAPGTFGTLAAIPLVFLMPSSLPVYTALIVVLFVVGVYFCQRCSDTLGVHDHPGIVFDEWVGYFITMLAVPLTFWNVVLGFALFRFFDILKPWPIGYLDKRVSGGFGIMIDDVLAGIFASIVMQLLLRVVLPVLT